MTSPTDFNPGSFRDPSGFIYSRNGILYRQINKIFSDNYQLLIESGLYDKLAAERLLIPHQEVDLENAVSGGIAFKVIQPEVVPFISYPYEWSFSQLKDAALITIAIQKIALEYGMTLKDASAFNIQFYQGKPIFIDTLSFEKYNEGQPWVAYKQFCQHFLAPLALMSYKDIRLGSLFQIYIDGLPLDLTSSLLPFKTKLNFSLLTHIHLHSRSQKHYADKSVKTTTRKISRQSLMGLIDNLESSVKNLKWQKAQTEWGDYYDKTNYSSTAFENKKGLIDKFLAIASPKEVWDIGANTGEFSRIAADRGIPTVSFDIDPLAVEKNYHFVKKSSNKNILPLLLDLTNPTPGTGWGNLERDSFINRAPTDTVMALALIHHLAIVNNLPFDKIVSLFKKIVKSYLIIEFIPKSDSQVQRLLGSREDIFDQYDRETFETSFRKQFGIVETSEVIDSERILYLMKKND